MKINLTKEYRIWWKDDDKIILSTCEEVCPVNTTTTLDTEEWNYFETSNIEELQTKIDNENLMKKKI